MIVSYSVLRGERRQTYVVAPKAAIIIENKL